MPGHSGSRPSTAASGSSTRARTPRASHIVVATPGRLEDQLSRGAFSLDAVRMLVLDEADRMLDMGFKPAVDRIVAACPRQRQTMFFSATLAGEAGAVARRYTNDARSHENGPSARHAAIEVEHRFVTAGEDRMAALTAAARTAIAGSRSCSCGPSAAPTGSSSD